MAQYDEVLLPVFYEMRRMGVPLGIPEYLLAVKTIRDGISIESTEDLKRLCCLLWAKSQKDQEIFYTAFEQLAESFLQPLVESQSASAAEPTFSSDMPSLPDSLAEERQELETKSEPPVPEKQGLSVSAHTIPFYPSGAKSYKAYRTGPRHLIPRLSIDMREMAGLWRHLRRLQREGPLEEFNVEGTIANFSRVGFFTGPILQPRRRNQARLVLLVDQQGSMAPFTLVVEALIESALRGGLLGKTYIYYFHDCPEDTLYGEPSFIKALPLEGVLAEHARNASILIVSDAGAARGHYDRVRVARTKAFLKILRRYTYLYAWLNPLPLNRWRATTADDIASVVPMFPLDREGLDDAISILRGHPFPPGVAIDG